MQSSVKKIAKGTLHLSVATFLSRILGFLRDIVIAFTLGAGPLADTFFVAFRIPNLLRRLFAEGSLTMAFVPIFLSIKEKEGIERAFSFSRSVFMWLFIILGFIVLVVLIFAKYVCLLVAPGFSSSHLLDFTATLLRICFPYILFISGVAMCMGILNAMNHFFFPAIAPCVLNLCLIGFALLGYFFKFSVPIMLSFGVLLAGILQFLMQQPVMFRFGFSWRGSFSFKDEKLKELLKMMIPSVFGAATYQIMILVNTILASFLPKGSISYLYYADRFVQFPLGVFGVAVGMASLPSLSQLVVTKKIKEFVNVFNKSIHLNLFISFPATAGLIGLAYPIIDLFLKRGAFTDQDVKFTSLALLGYAVGLPAYCLLRTVLSAYYSFKDTITPVIVSFFSLVINVISALLLMKRYSFLGLAISSAISSWAQVLILLFCFRKKISNWFSLNKDIFWIWFFSLLVGLGSYWSYTFLKDFALALIPFWIVFYIALSELLKIESWYILKSSLTKIGVFEKNM